MEVLAARLWTATGQFNPLLSPAMPCRVRISTLNMRAHGKLQDRIFRLEGGASPGRQLGSSCLVGETCPAYKSHGVRKASQPPCAANNLALPREFTTVLRKHPSLAGSFLETHDYLQSSLRQALPGSLSTLSNGGPLLLSRREIPVCGGTHRDSPPPVPNSSPSLGHRSSQFSLPEIQRKSYCWPSRCNGAPGHTPRGDVAGCHAGSCHSRCGRFRRGQSRRKTGRQKFEHKHTWGAESTVCQTPISTHRTWVTGAARSP